MSATTRQAQLERQHWTGPVRHYDILKEGSTSAPDNMYAVAVSELAGTSASATYGPPYNTGGDGQALGPITPQKWAGVRQPVDPANDFVVGPLSSQQQPADVAAALSQWSAATSDQQTDWATAYDTALNDPNGANGDATKVASGDYGPVPTMATGLVAMASSGALDGILAAQGKFFNTDTTKQILFLGDGSYLDDAATAAHLQGNEWGMMNETGNFPGQEWLQPFSFWYQLPIFNSSATTGVAATLTANADIYILLIIAIMMLVLILLPFIPGLRSIPRWIPIHKLVWRDYYARKAAKR